MIGGRGVDRPRHRRIGQERLNLGGEEELPARLAEVQGLDADPIAGEKQPRRRRVPDREGEHPDETVEEPLAPLEIAAQDDLGVAVAPEAMPGGLEAPIARMIADVLEGTLSPEGAISRLMSRQVLTE